MKIKANCGLCNSEYEHEHNQKSKYCSSNCRTKASIQRKIKGIEGVDYVVCGICSLKFKEINGDHLKTHNIDKGDYDVKYGNRTSTKTRSNKDTLSCILTPELSKKLSDSHKEGNYIKKYGEVEGKIRYKKMKENKSYKNSVKFYIDNYGSKLGHKLFNERHMKGSMTLQNQINLYGINDGTIKYNKWLEKQKYKNTISYYINLYGYDDGLNKWFNKNNKISIANSKIPKSERGEYQQYCILVDKFTRVSLSLNDLIDIDLRGKKYGYDLDHKVSKINGFKNNIKPEIIGHISNLEVITSNENRTKQHNSSQSILLITEEYNKDINYINIINSN
jgi:hypothetical protein